MAVKWHLDSVRGWWLLLRDVVLFLLGLTIWVNELLLTSAPARWEALIAGASAMALPFTLRADKSEGSS